MSLATLAEYLAFERAVLVATAAPLTIGLTISTVELLYLGRELDDTGIYGWDALRGRLARRGERSRRWSREIFSYWVCRSVLWVRLAALGLLGALLVSSGGVPAGLIALILATQLYLSARHPVGADGSDQMSSVVLVALAAATTFEGNWLAFHASIWFIALQSVLAYASSGAAKLISPIWRSGYALFRVLCTETYGAKWAARLLKGRPLVTLVLAWCVILFELLFFLVVFLPPPYALATLAMALAFHLVCAIVMGLNSFVWAFPATYPALVFCAMELRQA